MGLHSEGSVRAFKTCVDSLRGSRTTFISAVVEGLVGVLSILVNLAAKYLAAIVSDCQADDGVLLAKRSAVEILVFMTSPLLDHDVVG